MKENEREQGCEFEPMTGCPIRESEAGPGSAIGAMNGKWAFLLKAVLITTPAAWAIFVTVDLPWRIWVTRATFTTIERQAEFVDLSQQLERYIEQREKDYRELDARFDTMPPPTWRDRIEALEEWERENRSDHAEILVALEAIKAKLDILPPNKQSRRRPPQEDRNETATASHPGGSGGDTDGRNS